jgi:hypothetical protein
VFIRGGALSRYEGEGAPEGATIDFPLRSGDDFFLDENANFTRDGEEEARQFDMMAAISFPAEGDAEEGRAVVIADGDFITDQVIRNPGNVLLFGDIVQWLIGQEQIVGEVTSEEDVRIEHSAEEDRFWFWGTSFGVPLPFFAVAIWVSRRGSRRGSRRDPPKPKTAPATLAAKPKKEEKEEDEEEEAKTGEDSDSDSDSNSDSDSDSDSDSKTDSKTEDK